MSKEKPTIAELERFIERGLNASKISPSGDVVVDEQRPRLSRKARSARRAIAELRALIETLEGWQDADRTFTPIELAKLLPGWIDN